MIVRGLERLDRLLRDSTGQGHEVPGAVALVRDRKGVIFHEAYGLCRRIPSPRRMTTGTLFDLASLTKPVSTSLLAMILTARGRLDPEQDLESWLGPLEDPAKKPITVRQLLSNRSGLPAWRPFYQEYSQELHPISTREMVRRVLTEPLEVSPGEREIYSDLGFILLGSILERASGLPLDRLFRQEIAHPLGLLRIGYRRVDGPSPAPDSTEEDIAATEACRWRKRILIGEVHDENCHVMGGVAGHAGLFSTAADLDRIVEEIFAGRNGRSDIFPESLQKAFFQRQGSPGQGTWALGWDTPSEKDSASGRYYSKNSFGHNGFTGTSLWIDFDRSLSVILLTNRVHPSRGNTAIRSLRPRVHDAVFEELFPSPVSETMEASARREKSEGGG